MNTQINLPPALIERLYVPLDTWSGAETEEALDLIDTALRGGAFEALCTLAEARPVVQSNIRELALHRVMPLAPEGVGAADFVFYLDDLFTGAAWLRLDEEVGGYGANMQAEAQRGLRQWARDNEPVAPILWSVWVTDSRRENDLYTYANEIIETELT